MRRWILGLLVVSGLALAAGGGSGIVVSSPKANVNGTVITPSGVSAATVDAGTLNFSQGFGTNLDAGSIWVTQLDAGSVLAVSMTTSAASGNAAISVVKGSQIQLDGTTDMIADNGLGVPIFTSNSSPMFTGVCLIAGSTQNAEVEMCGGAAGVYFDTANGGRTLSISTSGNASEIDIGTSTTTKPVKIAGGSGAFVGTCSMSTSTSCTATVPTGAKCMCFPQTAIGVSTNEAFGTVSSTTFTCNSGGTSNSATWTILCL